MVACYVSTGSLPSLSADVSNVAASQSARVPSYQEGKLCLHLHGRARIKVETSLAFRTSDPLITFPTDELLTSSLLITDSTR